jgi:Protein of unknown function (DUF2866)
MLEDEVLSYVRAQERVTTARIRACRISAALQHTWGSPYRLVEWTIGDGALQFRRAVPAQSTPREIGDALLSYVPGRRYCEIE